jgi:pilus assembly protein CpaC
MLKVTVAEVRRDVIKQLGIDLSGTLNYGTAVVNFNTSNPFSANGGPLSETFLTGKFPSVTATCARWREPVLFAPWQNRI